MAVKATLAELVKDFPAELMKDSAIALMKDSPAEQQLTIRIHSRGRRAGNNMLGLHHD
jgi:hypothetical protein